LTGKVSDERFGYIKQFPHLDTIYLFEIWEGADSFLERIAGMESVTALCFEGTYLSREGMLAVASFPNLRRLHISRENEDNIFPGKKRCQEPILTGRVRSDSLSGWEDQDEPPTAD
jgi:hypothetical protein